MDIVAQNQETKQEQFQVRRQSPGFFWLDNEIINHFGRDLGPYGIAVYCALAYHTNDPKRGAWPSYQTIAKEIGASRRQVIRTMDQLIQLGLAVKEERQNADGGQTSNIFWLTDARGAGVSVTPPVTVSHPPSDCESPPPVTVSHPNNTHTEQYPIEQNPKEKQSSSSVDDLEEPTTDDDDSFSFSLLLEYWNKFCTRKPTKSEEMSLRGAMQKYNRQDILDALPVALAKAQKNPVRYMVRILENGGTTVIPTHGSTLTSAAQQWEAATGGTDPNSITKLVFSTGKPWEKEDAEMAKVSVTVTGSNGDSYPKIVSMNKAKAIAGGYTIMDPTQDNVVYIPEEAN